MFVYKITNSINNKVYIGRTTRSIERRWAEHLKMLRKGDKRHLYCAMRLYGVDKFHIEALESCKTLEELVEAEARWVEVYDSYRNGYNMTLAGESNPMECSKAKESHDRKMRSVDTRSRISNSMKALKATNGVSSDTRAKLSNYRAGMCFVHREGAVIQVPKSEQPAYLREGWLKGSGPCNPNVVKQRALSRSQALHCIDETTGETVSQFSSVNAAADWLISYKHLEINKGTAMGKIKKSASRKIHSCGLIWVYDKI